MNYGHQSHYPTFGQIGKKDVFIGNQRWVIQIGIYQVLDLAVVKKINPENFIILILNTDHDIRMAFAGLLLLNAHRYALRILLYLPSFYTYLLPFLIIETALIVVS